MWPFSSAQKERPAIAPGVNAADAWGRAEESARQTSALASFLSVNGIEHGANPRESAELQKLEQTRTGRRAEISRLRTQIIGDQNSLERFRASEKAVNERLSELNIQREALSRDLAQNDSGDPERHDAALEKIDREITRCNSRLSGLRKLIEEADQAISGATTALGPLETEEAHYEQHLAARQERKELGSIAEAALKALEMKERAEQQIAQALLNLRNRNHESESNRYFGLQVAEKLARRLSGLRE